MKEADPSLLAARSAKASALKRFKPIADVQGVGITRIAGAYGLKINIRRPIASGIDVPREIDGVPVRVEVVGVIRPA